MEPLRLEPDPNDPHRALRAELGALRLGGLCRRARWRVCRRPSLCDAQDGDEPAAAITELIV